MSRRRPATAWWVYPLGLFSGFMLIHDGSLITSFYAMVGMGLAVYIWRLGLR
jgi:hypothetical protein